MVLSYRSKIDGSGAKITKITPNAMESRRGWTVRPWDVEDAEKEDVTAASVRGRGTPSPDAARRLLLSP